MLNSTIVILGLFLGANNLVAQDPPEPPLGYEPHIIQSLFSEDYRNDSYESALKWGRYLVLAHPKEMPSYSGTYRGDRNISRMIDIYTHMAEEASDPSVRSANLDSVEIMFDLAFEHYEDGEIDMFRWHQRRGRFYQGHAPYIDDGYSKAYAEYYTMFEMDPERATETADGYYVQITLDDLEKSGEQEKALQMMAEAEPYAGAELLSFFDQTRNSLYDDPDERIVYLEEQREADPNDIELLEDLMDLYTQVDNNEKAKQYAVRIYDLNPSYDNIMRLVDDALSNAEYEVAIDYLKESIEKTDDSSEKRAAALQISDNYLNLNELENARDYAQIASEFDSNWGHPYIKIAEIYGRTVSECAGSSMTRQDKVVYWLVLDYLDKARSVDPSTSRSVNRLYSTYENVTPSREDMFYQDWNDGDTVSVDGSLKRCYAWINEETTVRSR
ncbi:MAG: hypothetical protein WEB89_06965 [Balneolales bacterium]